MDQRGHRGKPPSQVVNKSTNFRQPPLTSQILTHQYEARNVNLSQAFSPLTQGINAPFFSPLISPKEQVSAQPGCYEDSFGEPHFKQIFDGMIRKHANSPSRYTVSLACGQLMKPRYINPKIEIELKEFKAEIKQKFESSEMNRNYIFSKTA